ncbi:hypothetical protein BH18ACT5_BH18ACT5_07660 [soil metagenome]
MWVVAFLSMAGYGWVVAEQPNTDVEDWFFGACLMLTAVVGALIISKQPRNTVGWLLLLVGMSETLGGLNDRYLESLGGSPERVGFGLIVLSWFSNFSWVLLIFPLFHLLQVFPNGRWLSPRWRWVAVLEVLMALVLSVLVVLAPRIGPFEGSWSVENPIGVFASDLFESDLFTILWGLGLLALVIAGGISIVMRYRQSDFTERQQLKLLLFAFLTFVVVYVIAVINGDFSGLPTLLDLVFGLSIAGIPISIAFAITRKGLFDIDLIVRRTLLYAALSGLLSALYLASIFLLQSVFGLRQRASWQVAASTLLITALFAPLRSRLQRVIDRRLFRRRYDAQQVVEAFAGSAQNQADLDRLSAELVGVVRQKIQPSQARLWIRA